MRYNTVLGILLIGLSALSMVAAAAASGNATVSHRSADPGLIQPDSTLYGFAVMKDRFALRLGLTTPGTLAQKRAAQARRMADRGDHTAVHRALRELDRTSTRATAADADGLEQARSTLQALLERDDLPDKTRKGVQTALARVEQARDRAGPPTDPTPADNRSGTLGDTPAEKSASARELREQGRESLNRGIRLMDHERYAEARNAFARAQVLFREAGQTLEGADTVEAQELRQQVTDARKGSVYLQQSVQAYMDDDTERARERAQQAEAQFSGRS